MILKLYQVDAFTNQLFGGNPAAVCPLTHWLNRELMQKIIFQKLLFFVPNSDRYEIRWFTPKIEVDLCGHATLAAASVIFKFLDKNSTHIVFKSNSGELIVTQKDSYLTLDFPLIQAKPSETSALLSTIVPTALEIWKATDYMMILQDESQVKQYAPDFTLIEKLDSRGLIITSKGIKADFVSRWFGPQVGVNEDPVTGSAHCMLATYWASKLNNTKLYAEQVSSRLGKIYCEVKNNRVLLTGQTVHYSSGEIMVPDVFLKPHQEKLIFLLNKEMNRPLA